MVVFDIPSYDVHQMPFEKRYEQLLSNAKNGHPFIISHYYYLMNLLLFIQTF